MPERLFLEYTLTHGGFYENVRKENMQHKLLLCTLFITVYISSRMVLIYKDPGHAEATTTMNPATRLDQARLFGSCRSSMPDPEDVSLKTMMHNAVRLI